MTEVFSVTEEAKAPFLTFAFWMLSTMELRTASCKSEGVVILTVDL
jgi:hypothetical protein